MNTEKLVQELQAAEQEIKKQIKNHENVSRLVSVSMSNSKMGKVASVSMLPIITCPACCAGSCGSKCYALKLANLRPTVRSAYARNTAIAKYAIKAYFKAVDETMKAVRFFRFHVSGDILNKEYFSEMIKASENNPHCEILVFTKKYNLVNEYLNQGNKLPDNMHILFSGWFNLDPVNPYGLPETRVYTGESDFNDNWTPCGGNCLNCAVTGSGCWTAKQGETIAFKLH